MSIEIQETFDSSGNGYTAGTNEMISGNRANINPSNGGTYPVAQFYKTLSGSRTLSGGVEFSFNIQLSKSGSAPSQDIADYLGNGYKITVEKL